MAGDGLTTLTNQMKALKGAGAADPDLKLSEGVRDRYVTAIEEFQKELSDEKAKLSELAGILNPGAYTSAVEVKAGLIRDVTGPGGIEQTLDSYIKYLEEFKTTVKAVCDRFIQEG